MTALGSRLGVKLGSRLGVSLGGGSVSPPDAPTIGLATAGDGTISVAFTPSGSGPAATSFTVTLSPGGATASGASSPIAIAATNGTAYTATVHASNAGGSSAESAATGSVMPLWLWGVFPVWHAASTTPNVDGVISAIADVSLGLYPLSQVVGAAQPVRGSGVISFDGGDDVLACNDAALLAFGDLTANAASLHLSTAVSAAAINDVVAGWGPAAAQLLATNSEQMRLAKSTAVASSAVSLTTTVHSVQVDFLAGVNGNVLGYVDGSLAQTLTVTGVVIVTPLTFSAGAAADGSASTAMTFRAMAAMDRSPTAGERTQWDAYVTAGCPARAA